MKIKQLENNIIFYACMFAGLLLLSSFCLQGFI